eukprot:988622-Amphidinium_carterae.1
MARWVMRARQHPSSPEDRAVPKVCLMHSRATERLDDSAWDSNDVLETFKNWCCTMLQDCWVVPKSKGCQVQHAARKTVFPSC